MFKPFLKKILFFTVILGIVFASCNSDNILNETSIDGLAGTAKIQQQWGTLVENIPNNIGNTFTGDPETTRTITWQSTHTTGEVIIDEIHYPSTTTLHDNYYFHRVDITGLEAGKTYRYIVGSAGFYSPVYNITTQSTNLVEGFSILHITDPQIGAGNFTNDAAIWKRTIESAIKKVPHAAFVVNTGDVAENSRVASLHYYFDYAQQIKSNYAFMYSLGNNDLEDWYNRYFYIPDNSHSGYLYSFDYGNVHFVNINSNRTLTEDQLTWLENDLQTTEKKWKVAMMHEANYGRTGRRSAVTDLFDQYNVDLVLAGHNHFYARSKPLNTLGSEKENGTIWTIPNAAGSKFNNRSSASFLAKNEQPGLPMFTEFKFTETNISLNAYTVDADGSTSLFDSYALR